MRQLKCDDLLPPRNAYNLSVVISFYPSNYLCFVLPVFLSHSFFLYFIFTLGPSRSLFLYFRLFIRVESKQILYIKVLLMAGFEPGTAGVGSDRSTNLATTTARSLFISFFVCLKKPSTATYSWYRYVVGISKSISYCLFPICKFTLFMFIPLSSLWRRKTICPLGVLVQWLREEIYDQDVVSSKTWARY